MSDLQQVVLPIFRQRSQPLSPIGTQVEADFSFLPGLKAIIFDIYGTMLVSGSGDIGVGVTSDRGEAFQFACQQVGVAFHGEPQQAAEALNDVIRSHHTRLKSKGIEFPEVEILEVWEEVMQRLTARGEVPAGLGENQLASLAAYFESAVNPVWPMPGLEETLSELRTAGLRLGIISNAQCFTPMLFPALLETDLSTLGFASDLCFYSYEYREAKPSVRLFQRSREVLQSQGIEPAEVAYVGNDMRNDIMPAQYVGFHTIFYAGDQRSLRWREGDPLVDGVVPDRTVTSFPQLRSIVMGR